MALRSPVPFHNFWGAATPGGVAWTAGTLPNEGGAPAYQSPNLQAGDFAYVATGPSTGFFYLCTDPGLPAQTNAVWVQIPTGAGGSEDRFAPKWMVGNTLNGDTAVVAGTAAGFTYVADPGDGTGILAAVTAANLVGGDVWIRPGTYDFNLGPLTGPISIGANVRVVGAGPSTVIQTLTGTITNPLDQGAFVLNGQRASLSHIRVINTATPYGIGSAALVSLVAADTLAEDVICEVAVDAFGAIREGIRVNNTSRVNVVGCFVTGAHTGISIGQENPTTDVTVSRCTSQNNSVYGIRVESPFCSRIRIEDCTIEVDGVEGTTVYGIWLRSTRSSVIGCNIVQSQPLSGSGIRVQTDAQQVGHNVFADNVIECNTDYGIALEVSSRTTVTGNSINMLSLGAINGIILGEAADHSTVSSNAVDNTNGVGSAIECSADLCALTGNSLTVTDPIPSISVTGNNNTVGFNTSGALTPVSNTGAGNEVAHNI